MLTKSRRQKTPWDHPPACPFTSFEKEAPVCLEGASQPMPALPVLVLEGTYVYNPQRASRADFQQFLWDGLRFLRVEAQALGLGDDEVHRLLNIAFDMVHDRADGLWLALSNVAARGDVSSSQRRLAPYYACEEDRLEPIEMDYEEPLELLDPDAALLGREDA
jgi:hypothetical protein